MGKITVPCGLIEAPGYIAISSISSQNGVMGATEVVHSASCRVKGTGLREDGVGICKEGEWVLHTHTQFQVP